MYKFLLGIVAWAAANSGLFHLTPHALDILNAGGAILAIWGIRGASGAPSPLLTLLNSLPANGLKTVIGLGVTFVGLLLSPDVLAVLPPKVVSVISFIGTLLTAFGLYHAAAKKGLGS